MTHVAYRCAYQPPQRFTKRANEREREIVFHPLKLPRQQHHRTLISPPNIFQIPANKPGSHNHYCSFHTVAYICRRVIQQAKYTTQPTTHTHTKTYTHASSHSIHTCTHGNNNVTFFISVSPLRANG